MPVRNSQRNVLACTACVRRKTRCSKTIPCTACVQQNKADSCQREPVAVVTRRAAALRSTRLRDSTSRTRSLSGSLDADSEGSERVSFTPSVHPAAESVVLQAVSVSTSEPHGAVASLPIITDPSLLQTFPSTSTPDTRLTSDEAAALEFLAHGRRNVLDRFAGRESAAKATPPLPVEGETGQHWDTLLPIEDARLLLDLHQAHLTWMHNVVHLPTFRQEFETNALREQCDESWIALYYAIISQTLYHIDSSYLSSLPHPIAANIYTSRLLFDKSIKILFQAGFMDEHKITSVQAICLLLQVAHNFDKSDLICVLISAAIRISQCLNLHRLGSDRPIDTTPSIDGGVQNFIDREVQKRVWWFLVRSDWLQIPFQNTCQIHPAQFNTPMPINCYDDSQRMVEDDVIVMLPDNVHTSNSWVNYLHQLSIIVWKHQDRMFKVGYPSHDPDNVSKLYDQSIWADSEIKKLYSALPMDLREVNRNPPAAESLPVALMPGLVLICTAHKILTVHRHFQLSGFRDRNFAFSQLSCVSIAERSIEALQLWPDTLDSSIARKMWTTLTHVISCCITLVFALLYKSENALTHDLSRIRRYVEFGKHFISQEENTSSIARWGVKLLGVLMDLESRSEFSLDIEADIGDMIRRIAVTDKYGVDLTAVEAHEVVFPCGQDLWETFMRDSTMGDFLGS
ncbi:hypothetical protein EDB81DRAFT_891352 [Dactylonectria macrodidyma]|uniref:Zn(2)-C6 fungal-type domain-containing protein n=1 Tax=Dactylonectria macrodidyma TaxID=307937 RepID=A0A9P9IHP7_9HYPO|nr:hypothetical protein EDB81DRAFT_891352 [Dactylonectria macrodidyma]